MPENKSYYPEIVNLPFNSSSIAHSFTKSVYGDNKPDETGYALILHGQNIVYNSETGSVLLDELSLPDSLRFSTSPSFIGMWLGKRVMACHLSGKSEIPYGFSTNNFNAGDNLLDDVSITMAGLAKQIIHHEKLLAFCSICGGMTTAIKGAYGKKCSGCGAEHFPHIHPCAIVLVKKDDELLLVRKKEWAPGRYGLVAGFLDLGESLEECAAREVKEETGITVKNIRYLTSQCWPFPSQLMAGFVAEYESGNLTVDKNELEDAKWFHKDRMPDLPGKRSIARWIIDNFA